MPADSVQERISDWMAECAQHFNKLVDTVAKAFARKINKKFLTSIIRTYDKKTNSFCIGHKQSVSILEPMAGPCPNLCRQRNSMQMVLDQPCCPL